MTPILIHIKCDFLPFSLLVLLLLGFSSSTPASGQCVAWLSAGSARSSSPTMWRRTRLTCWWRRFSCILRLSLRQGTYGLFLTTTLLLGRAPLCAASENNEKGRKHKRKTCLLFRSVGHVNDSVHLSVLLRSASFASFICFPPLTGGTTRWSSTSTTSSQARTHTHASHCATQTNPLKPPFFARTQHTLASCSCALLRRRQVEPLLFCVSRVAADYTEIKNDFMASRESLPVMFIATPKDKKLSMWTKRAPSIQVSRPTQTNTPRT